MNNYQKACTLNQIKLVEIEIYFEAKQFHILMSRFS